VLHIAERHQCQHLINHSSLSFPLQNPKSPSKRCARCRLQATNNCQDSCCLIQTRANYNMRSNSV
jgi:hypothetical protein